MALKAEIGFPGKGREWLEDMNNNTTIEKEDDETIVVSSSLHEKKVDSPGGNDSYEVDELDLDIDFDEIEQDLERFQEDETVQQALQRGVDLKKYGRELEKDLKEVICYLYQSYILVVLRFACFLMNKSLVVC